MALEGSILFSNLRHLDTKHNLYPQQWTPVSKATLSNWPLLGKWNSESLCMNNLGKWILQGCERALKRTVSRVILQGLILAVMLTNHDTLGSHLNSLSLLLCWLHIILIKCFEKWLVQCSSHLSYYCNCFLLGYKEANVKIPKANFLSQEWFCYSLAEGKRKKVTCNSSSEKWC